MKRNVDVSGLLNVILNCILDIGFGLGVVGVAIGTIASQALSAILVLITLFKGDGPLKLDLKHLSPKWRSIGKILRIGIPTGIESGLFATSNVIMQSSVNLFGSSAIAGNTAASSVGELCYWSMHSFGEATMTFVGQNYGAKKPDRVVRVFGLSVLCVFIIGLTVGNGCYLLRNVLVPIFVKEDNAAAFNEILYTANLRLLYVCVPYFFCGIMDVLSSTLRGVGKSVMPMIMSILGSCAFRVIYVFTVFRPAFDRISASGGDMHEAMNTLFFVWPASWVVTILLLAPCVFFVLKRVKKDFGAVAPAN